MTKHHQIDWPDGKKFAFTVFDDTDWTTLENGPLVYDFLTGLGFRVTKSVWPSSPRAARTTGGGTCGEDGYLEWVLSLQEQGHEIGIHNATDHSSYRDETVEALRRFKADFGHYPRVGADHAGNREALYWGPRRLSGWRSNAYATVQRILQPKRPVFSGEDPDSEYFWGDLCRDKITYWRNFTFSDTDTLRACPEMPYVDPTKPFVKYYFAATNAPRCGDFVERLKAERLDRLETDGGACIIYTHFGVDFVENGRLDHGFVRTMSQLAERNGWFAPVGDVLDHLSRSRPPLVLDDAARRRLETRWMLDRVLHTRRFGPRVSTTTDRN